MPLALFLLLTVACAPLALLALRAIRRRRGHARWRIAAVSIAVAVVAAPAFAMGAAYVVNEWRLARFAAPLFAYPLPPGAREVGRETAFGVIVDGNLCEFTATREVVSPLPLDRVRAHYARLQLRPAIGDGGGLGFPVVEVAPRPGGYVVTAIDLPYPGGFDPRCT